MNLASFYPFFVNCYFPFVPIFIVYSVWNQVLVGLAPVNAETPYESSWSERAESPFHRFSVYLRMYWYWWSHLLFNPYESLVLVYLRAKCVAFKVLIYSC